MSYPKWIGIHSQCAQRASQKVGKSCLFFRVRASWCRIVSNKQVVLSRTATSGWPGGLAAITRWGTDVSEKIHSERHSRNNWIFEIHIDVLAEALLTVKIRIQKACKRAG